MGLSEAFWDVIEIWLRGEEREERVERVEREEREEVGTGLWLRVLEDRWELLSLVGEGVEVIAGLNWIEVDDFDIKGCRPGGAGLEAGCGSLEGFIVALTEMS